MQRMLRMFSLIFVAVFTSCGAYHTDETTARHNWPVRSVLFDHFRDADEYLVVYNKSDYDIVNSLQNAKTALHELSDRIQIILKEDDEITEEDLKKYPVYVAGTADNLLIKRLDGTIPVDLLENGFEFDNKQYKQKSDILKISFFPNPFNPQMPISVIFGNDQSMVANYLQQEFLQSWGGFFWDNWGYQVIEDNKRIVIGNFSEDSTNLWTIDKKVHWELNQPGKIVASDHYLDLYDHESLNSNDVFMNYLQTTATGLRSLEEFTGINLQQKFSVHVYPDMETKTLMDNDALQTTIHDGSNEISTVINHEYRNSSNGYELIPAIRSLMGKPKVDALEKGLAVYFTGNWQGTGYKYWGGKLYQAGVLPGLNELLDNNLFHTNSDLIINCMAAMFTEFLIDTKGKEYLIDHYALFENNSPELAGMENEWNTFLKSNYSKPFVPGKEITFPDRFLKGFNFAHEGYEVYNGYMGSSAMESLEHLKSIGANTVSIIPYSGFRSMDDPHPFRLTTGAGAENDAAVIRSAYKAEELGFTVMLKPQIWSWIGWTGDINMNSEEEWNLFFKFYDEWIMHYAMLAEIHHIEIFCVGNEFKDATLTHQKQWEELFDKVRKVYSGKITYAANWGEEFEKVTFWNKLDYIAVNCYYPLSDKTNPTDEELYQQMEKNLDLIHSVQKKYDQPLLITEIGFKSIDCPWICPHKDDDVQNFNETSQKRCYEAVFKAMENETWISGIYIWKWPTYMEISKTYQKDFNPCQKQAETVIRNWFATR